MTPEEIALERWNAGEEPNCSTFIDEDTITIGYGELDAIGCFEFPLPNWKIKEIYGTLSWHERFKMFNNKEVK